MVDFHKDTDIPPGSPGMAMIQEAQTEHIYRQKRPGDAEWCQRTFGFDPDTADQITRLADGHHFFKYGPHPETLVRHTRSRWEESITNTDEAFLAAAAADAEHVHYTKYWEPAQAVVAGLGSGSRGAAAYPLVQPYMQTSGYEPRTSPTPGASSWHPAIDLVGQCGDPVYAVLPGVVTK